MVMKFEGTQIIKSTIFSAVSAVLLKHHLCPESNHRDFFSSSLPCGSFMFGAVFLLTMELEENY